MSVDFEEVYPPASKEEIEHLEGHLERRLPTEYRQFLEAHNGAWLGDNDQALEKLFSLRSDVPIFVSMWNKLNTFRDRVPVWLLPVGQNVYGNLFAVSLRDSDYGSVWFWDHEEEADEDEPATEENLELHAGTWMEFINSLQPVH